MAIRFKKRGKRGKHFIAAWRERRGFNQESFAHELGIAPSTLSRIESCVIPYGQDFIETCAEILRCSPADLIGHDPAEAESIMSAWERIPPAERPRALSVLQTLAEHAPSPQPEPIRKRGRG